MLRDEIENTKKKNRGGLTTKIGGCRFCGQTAQLEVPAEWDTEQVDEAATEFCDCLEAAVYTKKKQRKEKAVRAIEKQFGEDAEIHVDETVTDLLKAIVDNIVELRIASGTIDIGNGLKAKIGMTGKGAVKVERAKTEKVVQEA